MNNLRQAERDRNALCALSISGTRLAYSDGNTTRSFDLTQLCSVELHSGEFILPDSYVLTFANDTLTFSPNDLGFASLHIYISKLPELDLSAFTAFNRCSHNQVFAVWKKTDLVV